MSATITDVLNNAAWSILNQKTPLFAGNQYVADMKQTTTRESGKTVIKRTVTYLPQYEPWGRGGVRTLYYTGLGNRMNYISVAPSGTVGVATATQSSPPVSVEQPATTQATPTPVITAQPIPEAANLGLKIGAVEIPYLWLAIGAGVVALVVLTGSERR